MEGLAILKLAVPVKYDDLVSHMDSQKFESVTGMLERQRQS